MVPSIIPTHWQVGTVSLGPNLHRNTIKTCSNDEQRACLITIQHSSHLLMGSLHDLFIIIYLWPRVSITQGGRHVFCTVTVRHHNWQRAAITRCTSIARGANIEHSTVQSRLDQQNCSRSCVNKVFSHPLQTRAAVPSLQDSTVTCIVLASSAHSVCIHAYICLACSIGTLLCEDGAIRSAVGPVYCHSDWTPSWGQKQPRKCKRCCCPGKMLHV